MLVPLNFEAFHRNIALNPDREATIERAVRRFHAFVESDSLSNLVLSAPIPQGSWAQGTIVRPVQGDPYYDIDFLLPMDFKKRWGSAQNPREVLDFVADRLRREYPGLVRRRNRCARIRYQEGFQIDIVPAHVSRGLAGPFQICNYDQGTFEWTNPVALNSWVGDLNQESRGNFGRAVVCFKRWRDLKFADASAPKSILLTVLAGTAFKHFQGSRGLMTNELVTLEAYVHDIALCMAAYLNQGSAPLPLPGMDANLRRFWPDRSQDIFRTRLATFVDRAQKAIAQRSGDHAITHWQAVFGDYFPRQA